VIAAIIAVVLAVLLIVRDLAARRRERRLLDEIRSVQDQLKQSDRLVNVGQVVSGLAQDLKSPLQGIFGSAEILAASEPSDAGAAHELKQLRDNVTRAAGIVRNLLAFTETTELDRRWHDLNEIVRHAMQQHRSGAGAADSVTFQGTSRLQLVYLDGRQIEKVLTTLLTHTSGSRNGASNVIVTTRRINAPDDRLVINIEDPALSMADDEATWSGELDGCRRILEAHGGSLEVEHPGGAGLRFHLELPVTETVQKQAT
jgi:two-component system cell cycle sensor histidine kinase/response regulator CckA